VKSLFNLFINICLLRAKPQDVPASTALMLLTLFAVIATGVPGTIGLTGGLVSSLLIGLLDVALTLILLQLFLAMMGLSSRLIQSATALFGTGVVINLLSLPVLWFMDVSTGHSVNQSLGGLLYVALLVWSLVIMGHILRHSFKLHLGNGILIAIGYFFLVNTLAQMFLPAA
jgi:hypothetical protein